jgi:flagellar hook-associated protein 1
MGLFDGLGGAISGMGAAQAGLQTTSHNISNVNTEGYSRQRVDFGTRFAEQATGEFFGQGVDVLRIGRIFDKLVNLQLQKSISGFKEAESLVSASEQVDGILADPGTGVSAGLNDFFSTMDGVTDDPANFGARQSMFSEIETLTNRFNNLAVQFNELRTQTNNQLITSASDVSQLAADMAALNEELSAFDVNNRPSDLLDRRDTIVNKLAEQLDVVAVEERDGTLNLFIANGQSLVVGRVASVLKVEKDPADGTNVQFILENGLTSTNVGATLGGGRIGGLNQFRSNVLDVAQNSIGQIAAGIAVQMNAQHRLGQDFNGNPGGDLFSEPTVAVGLATTNAGGAIISGNYGDTSNLTLSDYSMVATSQTTYTLTRDSDGTQTNISTGGANPFTTAEIDGFTLTINSTVSPVIGDRYVVQPTRQAAGGIGIGVNSANQLATALPIRVKQQSNANGLGTNTGNGKIINPVVKDVVNLPLAVPVTLTFNSTTNQFAVSGPPGGTLAYNPALESGKSFSLFGDGNPATLDDGLVFSITNVPNNGDVFVIENNTGGVSDNGNALLLGAIQTKQTLNGGIASFATADSLAVATIGTATRSARISEEAQEILFFQATERRDSISGVNLDEEAANLVEFERSFRANAQVIGVTSKLFDTLLGVIG